MNGTVHVIGAGMAGLAAAVDLSRRGSRVALHEASGQAGGRCRSFYDPTLGCLIDNGNHLILSGNDAISAYLSTIGASDALIGPNRAQFPFIDLVDDLRWLLRPGGRLPLWLLDSRRRVPGSNPTDYLQVLKLARAGPGDTVSSLVGRDGVLYHRLWEPLTVAVLNATPDEAAATLLWQVLKETFGRGEAAFRPRLARAGLGPSIVEPAVTWLQERGVQATFHQRLRAVGAVKGTAATLSFTDGDVAIGCEDAVVLAVPPSVAVSLLPGLIVPTEFRAIVNGHFRLPEVPKADMPFLIGIVGGTAQWVFVRGDVASVTVSAADVLTEESSESIAATLWPEVLRALGFPPAPLPAYRIVKEKRATFAQTPEQIRLRPGTRTSLNNVVLAGDWIDTGLPATIEGAVRSGQVAADTVFAGK